VSFDRVNPSSQARILLQQREITTQSLILLLQLTQTTTAAAATGATMGRQKYDAARPPDCAQLPAGWLTKQGGSLLFAGPAFFRGCFRPELGLRSS
jgi:hypothetical protein